VGLEKLGTVWAFDIHVPHDSRRRFMINIKSSIGFFTVSINSSSTLVTEDLKSGTRSYRYLIGTRKEMKRFFGSR
jgi:hypothetical protein